MSYRDIDVLFSFYEKKQTENYQIINKSDRPVKVDVDTYEISGGKGVPALTQLNLKRTTEYEGNEIVPLVATKAEVQKYTINQELVRLANNEGEFADKTDADRATNFESTGTMDKDALSEKQNYVESKLSFKFTALRMDGKTVEEAKTN
ncbi:hypothetical protein [Brochothrix thermosphacta]|uniref:hypothetical protein n=1 Tax=Brochothrix thermosphacta TaxID=2756 RepID=UPI001C401C3F|nr:hypothetical protein [Brochothrix thermosphacta]